MNDTQQTLFRSLLKIGAGWLGSKGYADDSTLEVATAGVMALLSIIWGVMHRSQPGPQNVPITKGPILLLLLAVALLPGCTTSQQMVTKNTLASLELTATAAVDSYDALVIQGAIPTNDVPRVAHAYDVFQASFLLALDAARYNTNAIAPPNLAVEATDLVNLITTLKGAK